MKRVFSCALFVSLVFTFAGSAHGQCSTPTINSFSISPNVIRGDESELATATVSACLPPGATNLNLSIQPSYFNATEFICSGGSKVSGGCNYYGVGPGNVTVTFQTNGANYTTNDVQGQILVTPSSPSSATVSLTVTGVGANGPGTDGPCPICGAGSPINLTNGDTWITQRDYSLPGLGGGLTLTRTWNSYWLNVNPAEESGIFGDSWRSNFEERIQYFPDYAMYWKGDGSWISFRYDVLSQTYSLLAPWDVQTTLTTDSSSGVWTITEKDGTQKTFNQAGYLTSIVDRNGNTTTISVDASNQNRISSVVDPAGRVLTLNYTNPSYPRLCTSISDSVGTFTQYQYDSAGRLIQVLYPDSSQYNFQYSDPNSNTLISLVTDAQGKTIEAHTYDSQRRGQTSQQANDSIGRAVNYVQVHYGSPQAWNATIFDSMGSSTTVNIYDQAGRLTQVADYNSGSTGTYSFAYDNINRLTSTTTAYNFLSVSPFTVQYGYDAASNRVSMTDPQGTQTTYGYDNLNRLSSLSNSWAGSFAFNYDNLSRRTQLTRPNGVTTTYSYDNLSHLLSVLHQAGGTTLDGASYTYDAAGNRLSKTDLQANVTSNYTYDAIYQLLQVTQGTSTTESYTYDLVGNRLSSLGVSPYQYNSSNELTSTPLGSYTYDYNGNMTSRPDGTTFTWDPENRLTQAVVPGTGTTTFKYDPFGRRVQKSGPLGTTNYLYNGMDTKANPGEELDNGGNILARYAESDFVDEPLAEVRSTNISYYEADTLGSITSLTNPGASLTNSYIYDGFGNLTTTSGTSTNPLQFTGRDADPETSLYYYRARYYSSPIGRFISEDPVQFGGGSDFFAYVRNNPVNFKDPSGLLTIDSSCSCSNNPNYQKAITWAIPLAIAAASRITDPGLRDCVINKLNKGVVKCEDSDCKKGATPGPDGKVLWGHALPFGHKITLCSFAFSSPIATPCLLIHEFAHTCTKGEKTSDKAMNQSFPAQCPGI